MFTLYGNNIFNHDHLFYFYRDIKRKIVANVRDVLIQEVMTISNSEFEGEAIDMDSVAFAGKSKPIATKHYFKCYKNFNVCPKSNL